MSLKSFQSPPKQNNSVKRDKTMERFTRTYSVIHLDAIRKNIENVQKRVGSDVKITAIVKANAYGHGAVRVAKEISGMVYGFAVATLSEALKLRKNGITNMILVLGYISRSEYEDAIREKITFSVLTKEMAENISACAVKLGLTAQCHVKINTGMNRIGFPANEQSLDEISYIYGLPNICCQGIFMHFATADSKDKTFARMQFDRFMWVIDELGKRGVTFEIRHCANSAAIVDMPEYALDMVREGIILYGLEPSDEVDRSYKLYPAMEIKSHVIFVKDIPAGEGISYGQTYVTDKPARIATVSIGYADGYPRSLSSKGYVLVRGKKAPVVGRGCMDQMMIDVTDIPGVSVDDVVTVVGSDGNETITVDELGELSGRFNYEFVCDISERVEKMYVGGADTEG